jgi:hypothetical protein
MQIIFENEKEIVDYVVSRENMLKKIVSSGCNEYNYYYPETISMLLSEIDICFKSYFISRNDTYENHIEKLIGYKLQLKKIFTSLDNKIDKIFECKHNSVINKRHSK